MPMTAKPLTYEGKVYTVMSNGNLTDDKAIDALTEFIAQPEVFRGKQKSLNEGGIHIATPSFSESPQENVAVGFDKYIRQPGQQFKGMMQTPLLPENMGEQSSNPFLRSIGALGNAVTSGLNNIDSAVGSVVGGLTDSPTAIGQVAGGIGGPAASAIGGAIAGAASNPGGNPVEDAAYAVPNYLIGSALHAGAGWIQGKVQSLQNAKQSAILQKEFDTFVSKTGLGNGQEYLRDPKVFMSHLKDFNESTTLELTRSEIPAFIADLSGKFPKNDVEPIINSLDRLKVGQIKLASLDKVSDPRMYQNVKDVMAKDIQDLYTQTIAASLRQPRSRQQILEYTLDNKTQGIMENVAKLREGIENTISAHEDIVTRQYILQQIANGVKPDKASEAAMKIFIADKRDLTQLSEAVFNKALEVSQSKPVAEASINIGQKLSEYGKEVRNIPTLSGKAIGSLMQGTGRLINAPLRLNPAYSGSKVVDSVITPSAIELLKKSLFNSSTEK